MHEHGGVSVNGSAGGIGAKRQGWDVRCIRVSDLSKLYQAAAASYIRCNPTRPTCRFVSFTQLIDRCSAATVGRHFWLISSAVCSAYVMDVKSASAAQRSRCFCARRVAEPLAIGTPTTAMLAINCGTASCEVTRSLYSNVRAYLHRRRMLSGQRHLKSGTHCAVSEWYSGRLVTDRLWVQPITSSLQKVANLLCAPANSASCCKRDGK